MASGCCPKCSSSGAGQRPTWPPSPRHPRRSWRAHAATPATRWGPEVVVRSGRRAPLPPPDESDDDWQDDDGAYVPRERSRRGARWGSFGWWLLAKVVALAVLVGSLALLYQLATSTALYVTEVSVD